MLPLPLARKESSERINNTEGPQLRLLMLVNSLQSSRLCYGFDRIRTRLRSIVSAHLCSYGGPGLRIT